MEFIGELVSRSTHAGAHWVAALNHEAIDDAVKNGAVIQLCIGLVTSVGIDPVALSLRQLSEVSDSLGCVVGEQLDGDISECGVQGCSRHERLSISSRYVTSISSLVALSNFAESLMGRGFECQLLVIALREEESCSYNVATHIGGRHGPGFSCSSSYRRKN